MPSTWGSDVGCDVRGAGNRSQRTRRLPLALRPVPAPPRKRKVGRPGTQGEGNRAGPAPHGRPPRARQAGRPMTGPARGRARDRARRRARGRAPRLAAGRQVRTSTAASRASGTPTSLSSPLSRTATYGRWRKRGPPREQGADRGCQAAQWGEQGLPVDWIAAARPGLGCFLESPGPSWSLLELPWDLCYLR